MFPPADPGPPFERSAHEGDGIWRAVFFEGSETALKKRIERKVAPAFAETVARRLVIHPHEASRFQEMTVAAFDQNALSFGHVPGSSDIEELKRTDLSDQVGLVPSAEQPHLLAVFNSGFQPRHGNFGMLSLGEQLIPPREDGCTVAVFKDGRVKVAPFSQISAQLADIVSYRQAPPCLVSAGEVHEKLKSGNVKAWAGQNPTLVTRRRSAVGVSKDGRTLFYALGTETEADVLAAGMKHLGAEYAAQLDINWNWTRLFFFETDDKGTHPVGALVTDMAKDRGEYVARRAGRDFFYVVRRH